MRSLDGNVHGSLIDLSDDTVSQLHVDADGLPFVVVTPSSDFPIMIALVVILSRLIINHLKNDCFKVLVLMIVERI